MRRHSIFLRILLFLVLASVLLMAGTGLFRAGWGQGYQAGLLAASVAEKGGITQAAPFYGYPSMYMHGWPGFGFGFHGGLFLIGFFFLIFLLFGAHLFGRRRRWADGPYGYGPDWRPPHARAGSPEPTAPSGKPEEKPEPPSES